MLKLNDNMIFWTKDFGKVKKLLYGYINPDIATGDDEKFFEEKQVQYLSGILNKVNTFAGYYKLHLYESCERDDVPDKYKGDKQIRLLAKHSYKQDLIKPFVKRSEEERSYIRIIEILSDDLYKTAVHLGVLFFIPAEFDITEVSKWLCGICEKYKFETMNVPEYQAMFFEIADRYSGSSIISDLGICSVPSQHGYGCAPVHPALVASQDIYGYFSSL